MKTKQPKEESDKSIDEETVVEPKTRARKKASDLEEEKSKTSQDEPKAPQEIKKPAAKPKAVVKKRPLGIRKTKNLRGKKVALAKKNVIKPATARGRKPAAKKPDNSQDKEAVPLIPVSEIKKEPVDEATPNSRSSSPKTTGRRSRLSSDMVMMKSVLGDSPSSLILGPRTSPYSMRSERSNSPSLFEGKNLRSGKPRKVKNNLLNEVVIKEQKKRRRLLSDSKPETAETSEECKKLKRGRSCSRDGSEISKCSDITESDVSLNETLNETENKELNKQIDKPKTELDVDIDTNVQISTIGKVPSLNVDSKTENKPDSEPSSLTKDKRRLSLKRSTSLDSDNNNSNRIKINNLNSSDIELKLFETENDTLLEDRSSILNCMSKTFNSKEVSKNIRKARRGKKAAAAPRSTAGQNAKNGTLANDLADDKPDTVDSLTKEINDLINNLDQNIDCDQDQPSEPSTTVVDQMQSKPVRQFYGLSKPLGDNNSIVTPDTPVKDKDGNIAITNECTPSKNDDSENIRLHYEEDSAEKSTDRQEITYKRTTVASIDKLMDRLKEFEEFDKRRQRQESESKSTDSKSVMVTNDVVLIPKSGADIKPLKDMQPAKSPEKVLEKENVLSCFENNSAISIVKRDQVRRSIDVELPNSVTLIKRNSVSARKESTSSNHSRESDAISIFEKSLGKDVTLTEIRKSVDKPVVTTSQIDLHQFATLQPNNLTQTIGGVTLDSSQISITPRSVEAKLNSNDVQITKRSSRDSLSRKSSGSELDEKMATIEKIKSPQHQIKSPEISITPTPVAVKSPESTQPMETEALAPPLEDVKTVPEELDNAAQSVTKLESADKTEVETPAPEPAKQESEEDNKPKTAVVEPEIKQDTSPPKEVESETKPEVIPEAKVEEVKPKTPKIKSARNSTEVQAGPSNMLHETPESQKRKENVLRTLGLLTHKAANEAKIKKLREKELIYGANYNIMGKGKASKSDYTGTLKTVIKLNRGNGDKKKHRSSLKMTFQKSKNRGKPPMEVGEAGGEDDAYYTIERREGVAGAASDGSHRKSHYSNRSNNHEGEAVPEPEPKETLNLVIPEKASSFSIHPGRLCMDQCFYCGGKFGLFDTPCHIAQMKSSERQKKVLDNEEKLTIDSCLCDACYRHVDRRANCPSYRKRPVGKPLDLPQPPSPPNTAGPEKPLSPPLEEESEEEPSETPGRLATCHTSGCGAPADHSIRRKWLIKMRSSVNKLLKLEGDYPGLHTIPLCGEHYRALTPLMACVLCRRRLTKHHNLHFIHHGYTDLNPLLKEAGIPVEFTERPVLCKVCRYYCTLLQRPGHNDNHARAYRRKLLQIYNVEIPPELEQETEDNAVLEDCNNSASKQKKKTKIKTKQRKSTEPEKDSESSERTTESSPEKEKLKEEIVEPAQNTQPLEEDIESLISSNKIPVPGAKPPESVQSDCSESDMATDETPLIPVDKQTELRYLLQKQNNPAQFQHKANLTQKSRNILKVQNVGIQKVGQQNRINEKNSKRIQKLGQIVAHKEKTAKKEGELEIFDPDKAKEAPIIKNISLNDECTIETIPNKKPADINTLKNKWQLSESFSQVKKNLSELSKKLVDKEPKKGSDSKYSNPVKRLETNPSISVRELFPGEEEMNLQCNIEFNNVKGVTPEGWEKCNTLIQYDVETKKLWNELQRPYGNQSSFLRHLILLEKYFRSGDLVLSHNASPHAANYSNSVQSRLRAYDNITVEPPKPTSLIEFRKKPSMNGKSLLKSSQNSETKKFMPPPEFAKPKPKEKKTKQLPPELIAINTPNAQGRKAIQNVLHNIQQLVKGVSASDPTEVAAAPLPTPKVDKEKKDSKIDKDKKDSPAPKEKDKKEGKKDTPKKNKGGWRPTLMPITPENLAKIAREPLKTAVDGHNLPSLVQVLSAGNRYHITFEDYNKMCLIRRERQQRLQEKEAKNKRSSEETIVTEIQTAMLGNGGTVVQNITTDKELDKKDLSEMQIGSNAATILKNVGLKNITIAPIPPKTSTMTSQTLSLVTSPSILSTPIKMPQLLTAVSITSETIQNNPLITSPVVMPKIPKSLTVIPQTVVANQVVPVVTTAPSQVEPRP
ncbi:unnamed protein product [Colias eurytheme]|nr:unnamed protein product [Colias eurytheme]